MPEGDAVFRTARRLDQALKDQTLTRCDLRWPSLATVDLTGRTVLGTAPRGKHMLTRFSGSITLHSHLRMDGSWRVVKAGQYPPGGHRIRAILGNERSTAVGIALGMLDLVPTDQEASLVGHLGPDLLDPSWTQEHHDAAVANLAVTPERAIGDALLDQRNLAGLGTIFMAEPLFACGVSPGRAAGEVDLPALVTTARRLLRSAALTEMRALPKVYKREGSPCRVCGTRITSMMVGAKPQERRAYYCPGCQS